MCLNEKKTNNVHLKRINKEYYNNTFTNLTNTSMKTINVDDNIL